MKAAVEGGRRNRAGVGHSRTRGRGGRGTEWGAPGRRERGCGTEQGQGSWVLTAYLKSQLGHVSHQPVPTGLLLCLQGKAHAKLGTKSWGHGHSPRDHEV